MSAALPRVLCKGGGTGFVYRLLLG